MSKSSILLSALQRQIDAADRQIDRFAYDPCDLTQNKIRIVEDAVAP